MEDNFSTIQLDSDLQDQIDELGIMDTVVDVGAGISSGAVDAAEETLQFAKSAADGVVEFFGGDLFEDSRERILPETVRPVTTIGQISEDITQFGVGMVGAGKVTGFMKLGKWLNATKNSLLSSTVAHNPYEERLADFIESHPSLANPVTAYLQADDDDSETERRMKMALEDLGTGLVFEGALSLIKGVKRGSKAKSPEEVQEVVEQTTKELSDIEAKEISEEISAAEAKEATKKQIVEEQKVLDEAIEAGADEVDPNSVKSSIMDAFDKVEKVVTKHGGDLDAAAKDMTKEQLQVLAKQSGVKFGKSTTRKQLIERIQQRGNFLNGIEIPAKAQDTAKKAMEDLRKAIDDVDAKPVVDMVRETLDEVQGKTLDEAMDIITQRVSKMSEDVLNIRDGAERSDMERQITDLLDQGEQISKRLADGEDPATVFKQVVDEATGQADEVAESSVKQAPVDTKVETGVQRAQQPKTATKEQVQALQKAIDNPEELGDVLENTKFYNVETWSGTPDEVASAVQQTINAIEPQLQKVRGTQTWNDHTKRVVQRSADLFGMELKDIEQMAMLHGKGIEEAAVVLSAIESMMKKQYENVFDMFADVRFDLDPEFQVRALAELEKANRLLKSAQALETPIGRALNLRRQAVADMGEITAKQADEVRVDPNDAQYLLKQYGGPDGIKKLKKQILATEGNPKALNRIAKKAEEGKGKKTMRSLVEVFRSMILFNTKTHITNVASNTFETFLVPFERYVGTWLTPKAFSPEMRMARKQIGAHMAGLRMALKESAALASKSFMLEKNILDPTGTKLDDTMVNKVSSEYWEVAKDSWLGGSLDWTGKATRFSLRALGAEDEFFKQINYRAKVIADATMEASERGLKGEALDDFVTKKVNDSFDPSTGKGLDNDALEYSRETTFTEELRKGTLGRDLQEFVQRQPSLQIVLPFVRTPTNLLRRAAQRTPLLNRFSTQMREMAESGDPVKVAQARGRTAVGVMIYGWALNEVLSGNVTGAGPLDPQQNKLWRNAGNQPYSIKVGDQWVSYLRGDPNFIPFALVANFADYAKYASPSEADEIALGIILAFATTVEDKAYFQGIANVAAAFSGENPARANSMERFLKNFATSFVPQAPLQVTEMIKSMGGEDVYLREAATLMDQFSRKIPGKVESLPIKFNWLTGEAIKSPDPYNTGVPVVDAETDAVFEELLSLGKGFRGPTKRWGTLKFDLTAEEFSRYNELVGNLEHPAYGGMKLLDSIKATIASAEYQSLKSDQAVYNEGFNPQADMISEVISDYLEGARELLLAEFPELSQEVGARRHASRTGQELIKFNR
jgi:hypothetical protein